MSWGTQVEVIALATFLKYLCTTSQITMVIWEIIKPIREPVTVNELFYNVKLRPHHFEFIYWDKTHYDCVVLQDGSLCCDIFPQLTGKESFIDIT